MTFPDRLPFEANEINGSIAGRFETVARLAPDRVAVLTDNLTLSYGDLDRQASRLAHAILAHSSNPEAPVTLLFDHDHRAIIALLAVLKAGRFYTALQSSASPGSLVDLLAFTQTDLLLTDAGHLSLAQDIVGASQSAASGRPQPHILDVVEHDDTVVAYIDTVVAYNAADGLDATLPAEAAVGATSPQRRVAADDLMGVFFTSGSTGQPKGVMRTHGRVLHEARSDGHAYEIGAEDRCNLFYHAAFGASTNRLFMMLLNGGTVLPKEVGKAPPEAFVDWLHRRQLTILNVPPPFLRLLLDSLEAGQGLPAFPRSIRLAIVGGSPLYRADVERLWPHVDDRCMVRHHLALTEAGVVAGLFLTRSTPLTGERIPVGFPLEGYEIEVWNDGGQRIADGAPGEITVRSQFLAPGYWRRPDLTAQKFFPDPDAGDRRLYLTGDLGRLRPDGMLEHLGRKDLMVKINGHRVEIEAVEQALRQTAGVREAAVVGVRYSPAEQESRLVAYVVPSAQGNGAGAEYNTGASGEAIDERRTQRPSGRAGAPLTTSSLRRALAQVLPDPMIPSAFIVVPSLPLSAAGKIDRQALAALPLPPNVRPQLDTPYRRPTTQVEQCIAAIWSEVLGVDQVGVDDHFLDLGGNSLLAARIAARVLRDFPDQSVSMAALFAVSTVADMAALIPARSASERNARNRDVAPQRSPTDDTDTSRLEALLAAVEALSEETAAAVLEETCQDSAVTP